MEQDSCKCSNKLEFKIRDLVPISKILHNDIINTGESILINLSVLNSSPMSTANTEIVNKKGFEIIHKENYLDPISQDEILVPDHAELNIESKFLDANTKLECFWLGNIECKIEY